MKIVYSFPTRFGTKGIGITAWNHVNSLLKLGVDVTVMTASCEKPLDGEHKLIETLKILGIKLPFRILRYNAFKMHDKITANYIAKNSDKIDVVHCWPSGSEQTLITAKKYGVKTVLERPSSHTEFVFDVVAKEYEKLGLHMESHHYAAYDEKKLKREEKEFKLADVLVCPSDFSGSTFIAKGYSQDKIKYHSYGYDSNRFYCDHPGYRKPDDRKLKFVYVGDCFPLKGLHYALDAFLNSAASKESEFYIAGKFEHGYRDLLKDKLDHPNIKCLGFVKDVDELFRNCDVLLFASISEGSALVTYEAKASGCLLLVSQASGAKCSHMFDGLVHEVGNVEQLTEHINLITEDVELYNKLLGNSILTIPELTWDKSAEKLFEIYKELIQ